ncbi:MAG: TetR family transcriptional regulator [Flavobacteriales bacterium]|nr:MAG: TetR family transcriptional regulator [Flavobacteriales bacterium]
MEEKNEFLEKTLELFIENGAKALTMDDIAKAFAMSKKTLYEQYGNKEGLLKQVLDYKSYQIIASIKAMGKKASNAIEALLLKDECIAQASHEKKSIFIRQLIKYYPNTFNEHILGVSKRINEILVQNVKAGREQGLFRADFDEKWYAKLFFQLIMSYESTPFIDTHKINKSDYSDEVMLFYLHAITTEKGKEILKNYK